MWVVGLIFVLIVLRIIYVHRDRKKNPQKWEAIDRAAIAAKEVAEEKEKIAKIRRAEKAAAAEEKDRFGVAQRYMHRYEQANRKIPKSVWTSLQKHQKAVIYKEREDLKREYLGFPSKTQRMLKDWGFDDSFSGID